MNLAIALIMPLTSGVCLAGNSSGAGGGGLMMLSLPKAAVGSVATVVKKVLF